jgi:hypothetical protein
MYKSMFQMFILLGVFCSLLAWSVSETGAETSKSTYQQVIQKLESLKPGKTIDVKMGTEKDTYYKGERFEARFQASQDCYFILMSIAPDREIVFLAPSAKILQPRIEGGMVYSTGLYPPPTSAEVAKYDFRMNMFVAPPYGEQRVYLFCSPQKFQLFEADFKQEPFYTIAPTNEERLQALLASLDRLKSSEWSGMNLKIDIQPKPAPKLVPIPRGITTGKPALAPSKSALAPSLESTGKTDKWFPPIRASGTTGKTDENKLP